ncbi:MAG: DUF6516 family protein [Anaerolineae bacterium]|nr:DUF6516 family protein [Anaerolineae bacterium]
MLGVLMAILQAHPLCKRVAVVEIKQFSADQFSFKIRAVLLKEDAQLQVRMYYNRGHLDYAYQLFSDAPLVRWDNKEEFRHLGSYPHHHHDAQGRVLPSPLTGEPVQDIAIVLQEVTAFLEG